MTQTPAIVTTLKQPGPSLASFLRYHLAIGFSRIFLFFDDPLDPYIEMARKFRHVRIIKNDAHLRRKWKETRTALMNPWFYQFVDVELKVRQTLNVEIAIEFARRENIDWLLHIDCDELFYPSKGDAPAHFAAMSKRKLNNLIYANYEGLPEAVEIDDYFKKVTLFKKNVHLFPKQKLNAKHRRLIRQISQLPEHLFLFYANGKSAARVIAGLQPNGGHRFKYSDQNQSRSSAHRKTPILCKDAIILHYPCCGFKNFWRKYKMLGAFPDRWFDQVDVAKAIGSFHLESRDVILRGSLREARAFYKQRVVIKEKNLVNSLIHGGIVCRIDQPTELLNGGNQRLAINNRAKLPTPIHG